MEIKIINKKQKSDITISIVFEKEKTPLKNKFEGKEGEIYESNSILYVGAGKKEEYCTQTLRNILSSSLRYLNKKKYEIIQIILREDNDLRPAIEIAYESLHSSALLKTKDKPEINIKKLFIVSQEKNANKILKEAKIITGAANWAKDLINLPANIATPKFIVKEAKKIKDVKFTIFDRKRIIKEKLNLVEAVTRTSNYEPQFLISEYKPKNPKNKKPYCLVGKGITFDTGGASLKPAQYMRNMKCNMAGAASVLATIKALSELKSKHHGIVITPLCENAIGGKSYRVDDVIKAHNGLTVEIVNTDAEGRLVLADALSYSQKFKPEFTIDVATLTGAAGIALGDKGACYMSNDDILAGNLEISSIHTDDKIWKFPLWKEYNKLLKSDVADLMNISENRGPGTIIGGLFLQNFIKGSWAHIDIGMSGFVKEDLPSSTKGATGLGIKLLIDLVESYE